VFKYLSFSVLGSKGEEIMGLKASPNLQNIKGIIYLFFLNVFLQVSVHDKNDVVYTARRRLKSITP
jgi:hypothetical protein